MIDKDEFLRDLSQFCGTETYHRMRYPGGPTLLLTDGAQYLAEKAGAFWLMDVIASYQRTLRIQHVDEFQVWRLQRQGQGCLITCDDGNGQILARQTVEYTDFPLDEMKLYAVPDEGLGSLVVMLVGEY